MGDEFSTKSFGLIQPKGVRSNQATNVSFEWYPFVMIAQRHSNSIDESIHFQKKTISRRSSIIFIVFAVDDDKYACE